MTHTHAEGQHLRSLGLEVKSENGRTDRRKEATALPQAPVLTWSVTIFKIMCVCVCILCTMAVL